MEFDRGELNMGVEHSLSFHFGLFMIFKIMTKVIEERERERDRKRERESRTEREVGRIDRGKERRTERERG